MKPFHFFNFIVNDECRRQYLAAGHSFLLFGKTRRMGPDGCPLCVLVASANSKAELVGVSWAHAKDVDVDHEIVSYFIHSTKSVEQGMALGEQELNAREN